MAVRERITEAEFPARQYSVDSDRGIVSGVKLIGFESRNGRQYPAAVLEAGRSRYEGVKAFVDHPSRTSVNDERTFRDWAGNVRNVRMESDGLYGDLHLRRKASDYEALIEAAESFWKDFGMSHVADCEIRRENGKDVVEAINTVFSVDIVTDPATTRGLYESKGRTMKTTVGKLIESVMSKIKPESRKIVVEMMESDPALGDVEMDSPAEGAPPEDAIGAAFAAAIMAVVNDTTLDLAGKKAKINEILKAQEKVTNADASPTGDSGGESAGESAGSTDGGGGAAADEEKTKENRDLRDRIAIMEAKTMLLESDREATPIRIKALAAAAPDDRKTLLESWSPKEPERRGSSRPATSKPADGANETFAEQWKERVAKAKKVLESKRR